MTNLETFTQAYYCALYFTETGDDGQPPCDAELSPDAKRQIEAECEKFYTKSGLEAIYGSTAIEQAGHDFWLTRNGHGAGFWDGDWAEPKATELTALSDTFGSQDVYLGDDGFIHVE
jgi:hypothetical protein